MSFLSKKPQKLSLISNTMKRFPRNPEQQAVWIKNVNREDWVSTNNSFLGEVSIFEFFKIR